MRKYIITTIIHSIAKGDYREIVREVDGSLERSARMRYEEYVKEYPHSYFELCVVDHDEKCLEFTTIKSPTPDLHNELLTRCKPWLEELRADAQSSIEGITSGVEDWEKNTGYVAVVKMNRERITDLAALLADLDAAGDMEAIR